MKYLAPKLKHRIQILEGYQDPSKFGFSTQYRMLIRLWAGIGNKNTSGMYGVQPIRAQNIGEIDTHEFIVRYNSIINSTVRSFDGGFGTDGFPSYATKGMGRAFDVGYSGGFDSIVDINPIKSDQFIFLEEGARYKGRLFRINRVIRDDNNKEYIMLKCSEIEEKGTGAK